MRDASLRQHCFEINVHRLSMNGWVKVAKRIREGRVHLNPRIHALLHVQVNLTAVNLRDDSGPLGPSNTMNGP